MSLPPCYPTRFRLGIYSTSVKPAPYTDKRLHPIQTRFLLRKGNCLSEICSQSGFRAHRSSREYVIGAVERVGRLVMNCAREKRAVLVKPPVLVDLQPRPRGRVIVAAEDVLLQRWRVLPHARCLAHKPRHMEVA